MNRADFAEIDLEDGLIWLQLDRSPQIVNGGSMPLHLKMNHAQPVPGVGLVGIGLQGLAAEYLGLLKLTYTLRLRGQDE